MGLATALDALSDVVGQYDPDGSAVRLVDASTRDREAGPALCATVEVSLAGGSGGRPGAPLSPHAATVTDDGGVRVEFSAPPVDALPGGQGDAVSVEPDAVRVDGDAVVLTLEVAVDVAGARDERDGRGDADRNADDTGTRDDDGGRSGDAGSLAGTSPRADDELAAVRNADVPPYEDVPYLRRLYESCETFAEMSREIEMDVAAETVRRYMIEAGVHQPNSYDTARGDERTGEDATPSADRSGAGAAAEAVDAVGEGQLVTDGVGLPDDLAIADVADAVVDSRTLYDVQRRLDLGRGRTRELLAQLNLLDLVLHRVADDPDRSVSREDVAARIRQGAPSEA